MATGGEDPTAAAAASTAAAAAVPTPVDGGEENQPLAVLWGTCVHDGSTGGLVKALDLWAPKLENVVTEMYEEQMKLRARLVSLETRTGEAVKEGAIQVSKTQEAVSQTAENLRAVGMVVQQGQADLARVVSEAQNRFNEMAATEQAVQSRVEGLGKMAELLGKGAEAKFAEHEAAIVKTMESARKELLEQRDAILQAVSATGATMPMPKPAQADPQRAGWGAVGGPSDPWQGQTIGSTAPPPGISGTRSMGASFPFAGGGGNENKEWKADGHRIKNTAKLDHAAAAEPNLFKVWRLDASRTLCQGRPWVLQVLEWAEKRTQVMIRARRQRSEDWQEGSRRLGR